MRVGRLEFERAASAYRLDGVDVPDEVAAAGGASLDATGLFLVGELHGVEQTPRAVFALARRLKVDSLAFEWSWDQFDPVVARRRVDTEALWSLPPDAEAFSGDGRFTAGHVRLLEAMSGDLVQVLCADVLVSETAEAREEEMAARLLNGRVPGGRMIAVLGADHATREPAGAVMGAGALLARDLPPLATCLLAPTGGSVWYRGERSVRLPGARFDVELPIGPARPAVVPAPDGG